MTLRKWEERILGEGEFVGTEKDAAVLEAAFDYAELEAKNEFLYVHPTDMAKARVKILNACSEVYAENDGERPSYD